MILTRKKIIKPNFWQKEQVDFDMHDPKVILGCAMANMYVNKFYKN